MDQTHSIRFESKKMNGDKDALAQDERVSDGGVGELNEASQDADSDMDNPQRRDSKRVEFTPETNPSSPTETDHQTPSGKESRPPVGLGSGSSEPSISRPSLALAPALPEKVHSTRIWPSTAIRDATNFSRPKPAIRHSSYQSSANEATTALVDVPLGRPLTQKTRSGNQARQRAERLAESEGHYTHSAPGSRTGSIELPNPFVRSGETTPQDSGDEHVIEMEDLAEAPLQVEEGDQPVGDGQGQSRWSGFLTRYVGHIRHSFNTPSGTETPLHVQHTIEDYVPEPSSYHAGMLDSLLKLRQSGWDWPRSESSADASRPLSSATTVDPSPEDDGTPQPSPLGSGQNTPTSSSKDRVQKRSPYLQRKWNSSTLSQRWGSASSLPDANRGPDKAELSRKLAKAKSSLGGLKGSRGAQAISTALHRLSNPVSPPEEQLRIERHIKDVMSRKTYLVNICRALMSYGAPTHRLEQYLTMSARVLQIESQFLYFPGFMLISFDDSSTHTTEVKLVRSVQGVSLSKLRDTHQIYKEVVHDLIDVNEATARLKEVTERKDTYSPWTLVVVYGFASACVGPFAFSAGWSDLPVCFVMGCLVGFLQQIVSRLSGSYAHVFEITAAMGTSFLARAIGSISNGHGGRIFCFSALAQSSIALILPGYSVLCAAMELLSRSMVAGSVRMVYAIIYSLFLGFSITIGTVLYGAADHNASSATTCSAPISELLQFPFVIAFTLCLIIVNQGKREQMPIMVLISCTGYLVTYFSSSRYFKGNPQVSNMLGALLIGLEANLYSRVGQRVETAVRKWWAKRIRPVFSFFIRDTTMPSSDSSPDAAQPSAAGSSDRPAPSYGLAAAAMLPAIFVQVPSGLSVSGSLISGLTSADQIVHNNTAGAVEAGMNSSSAAAMSTEVAFHVGFAVIQVAIGITVGLAIAAAMVYPVGKRRSGLFSF